MLVHK
jgi:hypothetical protein